MRVVTMNVIVVTGNMQMCVGCRDLGRIPNEDAGADFGWLSVNQFGRISGLTL